jgi:hypothetical protein
MSVACLAGPSHGAPIPRLLKGWLGIPLRYSQAENSPRRKQLGGHLSRPISPVHHFPTSTQPSCNAAVVTAVTTWTKTETSRQIFVTFPPNIKLHTVVQQFYRLVQCGRTWRSQGATSRILVASNISNAHKQEKVFICLWSVFHCLQHRLNAYAKSSTGLEKSRDFPNGDVTKTREFLNSRHSAGFWHSKGQQTVPFGIKVSPRDNRTNTACTLQAQRFKY